MVGRVHGIQSGSAGESSTTGMGDRAAVPGPHHGEEAIGNNRLVGAGDMVGRQGAMSGRSGGAA